jgi:hypothetical protein
VYDTFLPASYHADTTTYFLFVGAIHISFPYMCWAFDHMVISLLSWQKGSERVIGASRVLKSTWCLIEHCSVNVVDADTNVI